MMMFVSKVWGFDNPCGPLVFGIAGWRDNAIRQLRRGDRVILVGTKGEETVEADRNRVLGMMEPSTTPVASSDFPYPNPDDKRLFRDDGSYRWPYGVLNYRAWEFSPGLFLDDVAPRPGNSFGSAAAAGIVPLTADEEARVLAHPFTEIPLLNSISADRKLFGDEATKRRTAPPPAQGVRRGTMHMRREPAFVYWFRLEAANTVAGQKIGWAFDWRQRVRQFNSVSLSPLGGLLYKPYKTQLFGTAREAFGVEQAILTSFNSRRHPGNPEVLACVTTSEIDDVWQRFVIPALLGRRA
jgi:hypothetical protein